MNKFIKLFKEVKGSQILRQYARGHVLFYAFAITAMNGFSRKSLEIVRLSVRNKILNKLRKRFKRFVDDYMTLERLNSQESNGEDEKKNELSKIWVCWFQGIDAAPDLVKRCYVSLHQYITNRDIVLITEKNYNNYVQFPDDIREKYDAGIISKTHLSDLLRLELLKKYGGTWIDATVLLTGQIPEYMLDSELFLFQNLKPGLDGHCTGISNWFITAQTGNKIISLTLALLYEYWRRNDGLVDYYIFHDFFQIATEVYPNEWKKVIPFSNSTPHILLLRLFDIYDSKVWKAVKQQTVIHKLSYKSSKTDRKRPGTYYNEVLGFAEVKDLYESTNDFCN